MKNKIDLYLKKGQLLNDKTVKILSKRYIAKARNNLMTMSTLFDLNDNKKARSLLSIPKDYDSSEWVVITGYYAMYTAALSLLAKAGYRSKNYTATLYVLDELFVKKKILSRDSLILLKSAMLHKEEIEKLSDARHKREIAQYSVTKHTTKLIAEKIRKDAYYFADRCEDVIK